MSDTSDGISENDWEKVREISIRIVDAIESEDEAAEAEEKSELFSYLEKLENKYGERASIYATRADYVDSDIDKTVLLKKAFEIARATQDSSNLTFVSSSLAQVYLEDLKSREEGKKWLNEFKACLDSHWDEHEANEYSRLSKLLEE